ncbi:hypothetical protein RHSIM_Rhsim11G0083000 [Rhododendron simsii]|uniref:non-specific serine/threonine protein kinase n=1 Tax=Rhododendron simsii TaxID=118357 RepID=A0A834G6W6_RHOSS|nr:hypothetical protein RHSIM_Rhsim11G0083000 [Rhododendron simsii]
MSPKNWVFILLLPFLYFRFCTPNDTITPTQSMKDGDVLVSSGETFALGFFSPGNSSRRYVGIWYNKISEQTIVWVANRDSPINGTSGVLSLSRDGNLVIGDNTQNRTLWQTHASAVSYSARLLDSGNLVLFQGDSGSGGVVWQSFDHPTNTLLPNMKLGLDRRTGLEWSLTSWKSRDDPGTGEYSYRVEPNEFPQLILFKGSTRFWRIPAWLKRHSSAKAEFTASSIINGTYVNNPDQLYAVYNPINASNLWIHFVDELGSLKMLTWVDRWVEFYSVPDDQCFYYGRCGAYGNCDSNNGQEFECTCLPGYEPRSVEQWYLRDASAGCIKKREALSMCGNKEGFVKVANARIPDTSKARVSMSLSEPECKDQCLRNCSCLAYTSEAEGGARANCITWYENLMDVRRHMKMFPNGGLDLYVRVDAVELAQHMKSGRLERRKVTIVATSVVLTFVHIITLVCWLVMKKRIREHVVRRQGHLSTGKDIAVKRLSRDSKQGLEEFKNEVILIAKLQHRNLVKLLGRCILGEERMLVYDGYMAPEYAIDGLFSTKSDIFSFGVIVLEIMSGKMNRKFHHADHDLNLLGHAWKLWIDEKAFELIDPAIEKGSISMSKLLRCIQIGLLCVQKCPEDRPTMSSVVLMLVSDTVALPQPKQPGFYIERSSKETHESSPVQISPSINEVTMTDLEAR